MSDHLSAEDLAELERLRQEATDAPWSATEGEPESDPIRFTFNGDGDLELVYEPSWAPDALLIVALVNGAYDLLAMIKKQGDLLERSGARWCQCSVADRMHDHAQPHCPHHGEPRYWQNRAEQAEAEVERLRTTLDRVETMADEVRGWNLVTGEVDGHDLSDRLRAALAGDGNGDSHRPRTGCRFPGCTQTGVHIHPGWQFRGKGPRHG